MVIVRFDFWADSADVGPIEPLPEYIPTDEYENNDRWHTVQISDRTYRIDMESIDQYKKVLSHGGEICYKQGDHLSGKPGKIGNVSEFDSCQGNVGDFTKNQWNVTEKILLWKSCLKLFIVSCIFASIQVFSTGTGMIWVTLNMPSAVEKCHKPSGNCQGISHCLESGHPV